MAHARVTASRVDETTTESEIEFGSGNVFADLGVDNASAMNLKSVLAMRLGELIDQRGLTQMQVAELTGISQPDLSKLLRGMFQNFSSDRLVRALNLLSADVEISVYTDHGPLGGAIRLCAVDNTVGA